jgi:hypothetical protein
MKTKTANEAHFEVIQILDAFEQMAKNKVFKMTATIENVAFADFIALYKTFLTPNKALFMPGEIDNENMTMIYTPCPGCTIAIESEPCVKLYPRINLINYN